MGKYINQIRQAPTSSKSADHNNNYVNTYTDSLTRVQLSNRREGRRREGRRREGRRSHLLLLALSLTVELFTTLICSDLQPSD